MKAETVNKIVVKKNGILCTNQEFLMARDSSNLGALKDWISLDHKVSMS